MLAQNAVELLFQASTIAHASALPGKSICRINIKVYSATSGTAFRTLGLSAEYRTVRS